MNTLCASLLSFRSFLRTLAAVLVLASHFGITSASAQTDELISDPRYVVNARGNVVVTLGSVEVKYSPLGNAGLTSAIAKTVMAGQTIESATGFVRATVSGDQTHIIATVVTVSNNVRVFSLARGAKVQVKAL